MRKKYVTITIPEEITVMLPGNVLAIDLFKILNYPTDNPDKRYILIQPEESRKLPRLWDLIF